MKKIILLLVLLLAIILLAGCQAAQVYSTMEITSKDGAGIKTIYAKIPRDHLDTPEKQASGDVNSAIFVKGFKPVAEFLQSIAPENSVVNFREEEDYWIYSLTFTFNNIDEYNQITKEMIREDLYIHSELAPATLTVKQVAGGHEVTFNEKTRILEDTALSYITELFYQYEIFEHSRRGAGANYPPDSFDSTTVEVKIGDSRKVQPYSGGTVNVTGFIPSDSPAAPPALPDPTVWPSPSPWPSIEPYWPTEKFPSDKLDYSIVIFPDTQPETEYYPDMFYKNIQWIVDNAEKNNIKYVAHVGDITDDNVPLQWYRARKAMTALDGVVPYGISIGNHDYPQSPMSRDSTLYNQYFPYDKYKDGANFGGAFEEGKMDNFYQTFEAGEHKYLVVHLEFGPRDEVLDWTNDVISSHPDHRAIIVTHAYLYRDYKRMDSKTFTAPSTYEFAKNPGETVNDGDDIWEKVASKHKNMFMVITGHVHEPANPDDFIYIIDKGENGNEVIQLLADNKGFGSYLFLLSFTNDGNTIGLEAYSPNFDAHFPQRKQIFINYNEAGETPAESETDAPTATEEPAETEKPEETEEPAVTEEPVDSEQPADTEKPTDTRKPDDKSPDTGDNGIALAVLLAAALATAVIIYLQAKRLKAGM